MNIPRTAPSLEQRIIGVIRVRHYSRQTEQAYVGWYKRFVLFQKQLCCAECLVSVRLRVPGGENPSSSTTAGTEGHRGRKVRHPAKQSTPLAPREQLRVGRAEALTNFGSGGGSGGLGLLLRSKRATLLARSSRVVSEGAKGRLAVQGAGLAKSRLEALGKGLSLGDGA